jgi:hypothetical protein
MEEVLETYAKPYYPRRPVLCMDEQPVQLLKETRVPIPATRRHAKRVDYEYERAGTANIFMFAEPLAGWREVAVRDTKTKVDWAVEMALLMEGRYAKVERVTVVCDNLNSSRSQGGIGGITRLRIRRWRPAGGREELGHERLPRSTWSGSPGRCDPVADRSRRGSASAPRTGSRPRCRCRR